MTRLLLIAMCFVLASCAGTGRPPPEPRIVVKEVQVPVPVPCRAMAQLGPEPVYPDTDAAVRAAPNLFERVKLLAQGRLMRVARLAEYGVAKATCL